MNIISLIGNGIHTPTVDGYPLYARVDGVTGNESKSNKWLSKSVNYFNSPTNIRNIYISKTEVTVVLYSGIYGNGSLGSLVRKKAIKDSLIDEYIAEVINYQPMTKRGKVVTGNSLKAISGRWVCNNIERIYIDETSLLGTDAEEILGLNRVQELLQRQSAMTADELLLLICKGLDCTPQNINNKYPRLHTVVYDVYLSDYLGQITNKDSREYDRLHATETGTRLKLKGARRDKFHIRMGVYKYDDLVLSKRVHLYTKSAKHTQEEPQIETQDEPQIETQDEPTTQEEPTNIRPTEKSKEEELLTSIYGLTGLAGLKRSIEIIGFNTVEAKLTEDGYQLCLKALGKEPTKTKQIARHSTHKPNRHQ